MGARPGDYQAVSPHNSFIHVDQFTGPRELAEYLLELDKDNEKYNHYFQVGRAGHNQAVVLIYLLFQWKGTGEFINTRFFCRVCALLHDTQVGRAGVVARG